MERDELELFNSINDIKREDDGTKRVELTALEFDWIFAGESAVNFINRLVYTRDDDLFAVQSIRVLILFLWKRFYTQIAYKIFLPFIIYFVFIVTYISKIYEDKLSYPDNPIQQNIDIFFISMVLLGATFFFYLELLALLKQRLEYFVSFWNLMNLSSLGLNIAFCAFDLCNVDPYSCRALGSVAVWVMWCKVFYFLRFFGATSQIVRIVM